MLADENINGFEFTKFPGGGLEYGEGIAEGLIRELWEEGQIEIDSSEHLYTTDFFQRSAFKKNEQIISVYYKVRAEIAWTEFESDQSFGEKQHKLRLYFKKISELNESDLTFPIDKEVYLRFLKKK